MADEIYSTGTIGASTGTALLSAPSYLLQSTGTLGGTTGAIVLGTIQHLIRSTSTVGGTTGAVIVGPASTNLPLVIEAAVTGRSIRCRLTAEGSAMTLRGLVDHILALWGRCSCSIQDVECGMQDELLACAHWALQRMYTRAPVLDYFNRTTLTETITGGTNTVTLDQDIQKLLGPVRLTDDPSVPLHEIRNRTEFDTWLDVAYGGAARAPDGIRAYHLLKERRAEEDSVKLTILVTPTPADDTDIDLDVATECPRYSWYNVAQGSMLQIPHRYVETLLLPLVLKRASAYRHFTRVELQPQIDEAYQTALATLDLASPKTPAQDAVEASLPKKA